MYFISPKIINSIMKLYKIKNKINLNIACDFGNYIVYLLLMPKSRHNKSAFPVSNKLPGGPPIVPPSKL